MVPWILGAYRRQYLGGFFAQKIALKAMLTTINTVWFSTVILVCIGLLYVPYMRHCHRIWPSCPFSTNYGNKGEWRKRPPPAWAKFLLNLFSTFDTLEITICTIYIISMNAMCGVVAKPRIEFWHQKKKRPVLVPRSCGIPTLRCIISTMARGGK